VGSSRGAAGFDFLHRSENFLGSFIRGRLIAWVVMMNDSRVLKTTMSRWTEVFDRVRNARD
jgi:hypothetical protein